MIFIIVLCVLSLDRLSKLLAAKKLLLHQSLPVIKGFFHLTLVHNRGAAFGILKNQTFFFILTAVSAIILISLKLGKHKAVSLCSIALGLILSGALGNLIDRLFFGYVIDFLDFRIWPVFNIADTSITIGAILIGWHTLLSKDKCTR